MIVLHYVIVLLVEGFFFLFLACLIAAGLTELINRREPRSGSHAPRYPWWEHVRAWYYGYQIDRLAASIERRLERKQRRAEASQRNHRF